ncbi:MAG: hypothetical protein CVV30_02305 [Methanomicrobiales archaeon HGW-Methanomicrobiales-1]|nr:MAG: hypothetical protein CVV30_02305 [Methanomicrobiales archaeon HGW-Methanomicrobiales-1]
MLIVGGAILVLLIVALYASGILAPIMNVSIAGKYVNDADSKIYIILNSDGTYINYLGYGSPEKGKKFSVNGNTVEFCPSTITLYDGDHCILPYHYKISNNQLIGSEGRSYTKI